MRANPQTVSDGLRTCSLLLRIKKMKALLKKSGKWQQQPCTWKINKNNMKNISQSLTRSSFYLGVKRVLENLAERLGIILRFPGFRGEKDGGFYSFGHGLSHEFGREFHSPVNRTQISKNELLKTSSFVVSQARH